MLISLVGSYSAMSQEGKIPTLGSENRILDRALFASSMKQFVGATLKDFFASCPAQESKITILLNTTPQDYELVVHCVELPTRPTPPVKVQILGAPRSSATSKDSQWVADRKYYTDSKPADVNEIILSEPNGALLEGSQSNFFVVCDGAIHTAGEGILFGTVRDLALRVCEQMGIPVVLKPPNVAEIEKWDEVFISRFTHPLLETSGAIF